MCKFYNLFKLLKYLYCRNNFLDQRQTELPRIIEDKCPISTPVILLMDNINLYRGRKRHFRLAKSQGPNMWNFTVRGAIIPDISRITDLMTVKETATMSQSDMSCIKAEDLFLGRVYCIHVIIAQYLRTGLGNPQLYSTYCISPVREYKRTFYFRHLQRVLKG